MASIVLPAVEHMGQQLFHQQTQGHQELFFVLITNCKVQTESQVGRMALEGDLSLTDLIGRW